MITNALLKNFLKKVTLLQFTKSAIEMFKVNNGLLVQVVSENFSEKHYNFRHQSGTKFTVDHVNTQTYGKQCVSYFGPKTWNSIPKEKKNITSLAPFKIKIKNWKPLCLCRISRIYIQRAGFMQFIYVFVLLPECLRAVQCFQCSQCFQCVRNLFVKKFKTAQITSFILLLNFNYHNLF